MVILNTHLSLKSKFYLPYLDGLRAIAALYVVLNHIALYFKFNFTVLNSLQSRSISIFHYGHQAVNFFIVLSGFCLAIPFVGRRECSINPLDFYIKRAKRILIPYYVAMFISLLLIASCIGDKNGTIWDYSLPVSTSDIILHLFLLHDLFSSHLSTINGPFWSISVEFRIYLIFPLLVLIWQKRGIFKAFLIACLISVVLFSIMFYVKAYIDADIALNWSGVSPYLILFTFGMAASYISFDKGVEKWRSKVPWLLLSLGLLIVNRFIITLKPFVDNPYSFQLDDIIFGFVVACLLISISGEKATYLKRALSFKPLVFIGTFAFSIYLLHYPILQLIWRYIINHLQINTLNKYYMMIVIGIPIVLGLAYLFYLLFERPYMNNNKPLVNELGSSETDHNQQPKSSSIYEKI